jgi:hypothetical protein
MPDACHIVNTKFVVHVLALKKRDRISKFSSVAVCESCARCSQIQLMKDRFLLSKIKAGCAVCCPIRAVKKEESINQSIVFLKQLQCTIKS